MSGDVFRIGMLEPTSGQVTVEGLDNRQHIQDVRRLLGFCPQYGKEYSTMSMNTMCLLFVDILYNELSVVEHLELIGKVFTKQ